MPTHHCMRLRALLCLRPQLPLPPSSIEKRSPNPSLRVGCKTYARVAGSPATVHAPHILFTDFVVFNGFFLATITRRLLCPNGAYPASLSVGRWNLGSTWEPRVTWGVLRLGIPSYETANSLHYLRGLSLPIHCPPPEKRQVAPILGRRPGRSRCSPLICQRSSSTTSSSSPGASLVSQARGEERRSVPKLYFLININLRYLPYLQQLPKVCTLVTCPVGLGSGFVVFFCLPPWVSGPRVRPRARQNTKSTNDTGRIAQHF